MHTTASSLVAIAQYIFILLYGSQQKFNVEAVNHYPPIRFEIRFERKFLIRRSLACLYKQQQYTRFTASIPKNNRLSWRQIHRLVVLGTSYLYLSS